MSDILQDLRYAVRMLGKNPMVTLVAVLSLALGIGANTTIFTLVNKVLLNPLPVEEPSRLVSIFTTDLKNTERFQGFMQTSYPNFDDYRRQADAFSGMAAFLPIPLSLSSGGDPEQVNGEIVSGNYFDVLGVKAPAGRAFSFTEAEDKQLGAHAVVVLSDRLWRRRFGADRSLVNKTIQLNRQTFTVVGIAPPNFRGINALGGPVLWIPISSRNQVTSGFIGENFDSRRALLMNVVARLKPGVAAAQAQAVLRTKAAQLEKAFPVDNDSRSAALLPVNEGTFFNPEFRKDISLAGWVLMGVVGLVLLIACANVANLLLARAAGRQREIAVRISLGASRSRLIRQLLTESILLGLIAGAAGLLVARVSRDLLWARRPPFLQADALDLRMDPSVLAFTMCLALLTGVLFGLVPALQLSRPDLAVHLKDRSAVQHHSNRLFGLRNVLVMVQVALSLMALVGAGLFLRSLQQAQSIHPGFETERLLMLSFDTGAEGYSGEQATAFQRQVLERVSALPAVQSAVLANSGPFAGGFARTVFPEGVDANDRRNGHLTPLSQVGVGYFETLGMPLVRGRSFTEADREGAPMVAIVNETMARRLWPGQEAIGRRFSCFGENWIIEVVGVARDAKYFSIGEDAQAFFYLPLLQHPAPDMTLHVRTKGNPAGAAGEVRRMVQSLDPRMPLTNLITIREVLAQALWAPRMAASLLGAFGLLALLLTALGVHGVISYSVSQRTQEIGIRMAMGARPGDVLQLVMRQTLITTAIGSAVGLGVALAATRGLGNLLIGVRGSDPVTFAGTAAVILLVALLASFWPALRAGRIDPLVALRYE